jgi:hypothetical protein
VFAAIKPTPPWRRANLLSTKAVAHLVDLRDLAELEDDLDTFSDRSEQIIDQYPSRSAFLNRLDGYQLKPGQVV